MTHDPCSPLGSYAACSGNSLPTFWDNLPFILNFLSLENMRPIGCPETSVMNYNYTLRNNPEERISYTALPFNGCNVAVVTSTGASLRIMKVPCSNSAWGTSNLSEDCCSPSTLIQEHRAGRCMRGGIRLLRVRLAHTPFIQQAANIRLLHARLKVGTHL